MRLMLFGDLPGIPQLLGHLPREQIVGMVAAAIRPQYHAELGRLAAEIRVPLLIQPRVDDPGYSEFRAAVARMSPDLIWVNSYSMIVREDVMALAPLGGINIHAAMLPRYRGCNPIQWAIINGECHGGVTLHEMTAGLDEGPIIDQRSVPILFEDTWVTVRDRIMAATDELIRANLQKILSGQWSATPQNDVDASYGRRRTRDDGQFFWHDSVFAICNKIRALLPPLPPAYYLSPQGEKIEQPRFMTPMAVTGLKFGEAGRHRLAGAGVCLRPLQAGDETLVHEWRLHPEAVLHGSPFSCLPSDAGDAMRHILGNQARLVAFVVEDLSSSAVLGAMMLGDINWHHRRAEMFAFPCRQGWDGSRAWSEAVGLLCGFGFDELELRSITMHVPLDQEVAIKSLACSGFQQVAILREAAWLHGGWRDTVLLNLARAEDRS